MIVVIGKLGPDGGGRPTATRIAERVAAQGSAVEIVGVVPADGTGDRTLLALRTAGVGHAAVARNGVSGLEPADLDLALRYLPDIGAIVMVEPGEGLAATAASSASWSGAGLVVVTEPGASSDTDAGDRAIVLAGPTTDPDDAFAGFVAKLAIQLAAGAAPADAWAETTNALGVDALGRTEVRPASST